MVVDVYVWWAADDEGHRDTFVDVWLRPLVADGRIRVHDEKQVLAGDDRRQWRRRASSGAAMFLALVTARLVASGLCAEIVEALDAQPDVLLIPILVGPVLLDGTIFEGRAPLPNEPRGPGRSGDDPKTIADYHPRDSGWRQVVKGLRERLAALSPPGEGALSIPVTAGRRGDPIEHVDNMFSKIQPQTGEVVMQAPQIHREDANPLPLIGLGSRLDSRYRVLDEPVRRAGVAVVPAWDLEEREAVLVHLLGAGLSGSAATRGHVFSRVEEWSRLRGAAVVPVLEPRRRDGSRHYFVCALDDGPALLDVLLREALPPAAVVPLVVSVARELERLHAQGFVHGNVRPRDVFLHRDGRLRLGPPHPLVGVDLTGMVAEVLGSGSGEWAPELHEAPQAVLPADPRTDVYGLAFTAAVALSGTYPPGPAHWSAASLVDGLRCDRELKAVLRRALSASPEDRHSTVRELRLDLVRAYRAARISASPELVLVPGGRIRMVWELAGKASPSRKRAQRATVSGFRMGKYPVTQAQYEAMMGVNPSGTRGPDHPVTRVSFHDAVEYCNRLSILEGLEPVYSYEGGRVRWRREADGYRLPTEAEWELAARGTAGRTFAWGDEPITAQACWNGEGNAEGAQNRTGTSPVNAHPAGATPAQSSAPDSCVWDMTGNVWEWCWDYFGPYAGFEGDDEPEVADPIGPAHPVVPTVPNPVPGAQNRLLRGGSWRDVKEEWMHASARNTDDERARQEQIGFRVARGPLRGTG